ncbi:hypothetical protein BH09BAC2_BH09BAC2_17940 [soil metagenome]
MNKTSKYILLICSFCFAINVAHADRGGFGRKKSRINLNIDYKYNLKRSIISNLKSGLNYKGSTIVNQQVIGNNMFETNLVTYKKGNNVFVLPYKQKFIIPEYTSTGYKLIIRSK